MLAAPLALIKKKVVELAAFAGSSGPSTRLQFYFGDTVCLSGVPTGAEGRLASATRGGFERAIGRQNFLAELFPIFVSFPFPRSAQLLSLPSLPSIRRGRQKARVCSAHARFWQIVFLRDVWEGR